MTHHDSHIVSSFDEELRDLSQRLVTMNDHCCAMLSDAIALLSQSDEARAKKVIAADNAIDKSEEETSLFALKLLALRQPLADDLRIIVSSIRIASDIERIADYASNIAESLLHMKKSLPAPQGLAPLGAAVLTMLKKTSQLLSKPSGAAAIHLWHQDDNVNDLYLGLSKAMSHELVSLRHSDDAESFMQYIFIAKTFERVGDRITNICEAIYYQRKGTSLVRAIRHDS